ncbi:hypothetical protein QYS47_30745 [Marivirga arenosa]|uniref:Uncharacterized protein n=1 Tax=Marivirga arenosa TaxID=3059076 RepID=A0AA52EXT4_9BACT|nr:hypothetical protein QYS47_30745 [Marivirga sp. BKB1-2]
MELILKVYFKIQLKILSRYITDAGINKYLGWALIFIAFVFFSNYTLSENNNLHFIYILVPIFLIAKIASKRRLGFLEFCFPPKKFYKIRLIESLILSLPFAVFLLYYSYPQLALILFILSFLLAFYKRGFSFNIVVPTPFGKYPYEFIIGFRKTFPLILASYFLVAISIMYANFHLALFVIFIQFILSAGYFMHQDLLGYVWVYKHRSHLFLLKKIKLAFVQHFVLYGAELVLFFYFFSDKILLMLIFYFLGALFLSGAILLKYSAFPERIGVKESMLVALAVYFPPLLIALIPYFYVQSVKSLAKYLDD